MISLNRILTRPLKRNCETKYQRVNNHLKYRIDLEQTRGIYSNIRDKEKLSTKSFIAVNLT
jgi:hypothetical protein